MSRQCHGSVLCRLLWLSTCHTYPGFYWTHKLCKGILAFKMPPTKLELRLRNTDEDALSIVFRYQRMQLTSVPKQWSLCWWSEQIFVYLCCRLQWKQLWKQWVWFLIKWILTRHLSKPNFVYYYSDNVNNFSNWFQNIFSSNSIRMMKNSWPCLLYILLIKLVQNKHCTLRSARCFRQSFTLHYIYALAPLHSHIEQMKWNSDTYVWSKHVLLYTLAYMSFHVQTFLRHNTANVSKPLVQSNMIFSHI